MIKITTCKFTVLNYWLSRSTNAILGVQSISFNMFNGIRVIDSVKFISVAKNSARIILAYTCYEISESA